MQFLKKIAWTILLLLLFGGLVFGGIFVRNALTAKNYSDYWQQKTIDGGDFIYVAVGDSSALGIGATDPKKSYVGILAAKIQETTGKLVKVINLASSNADIDQVISVQIPKLHSYKPDLVTVTVGIADVDKGIDPSVIAQKYDILLKLLPSRISYIAQLPSVYDYRKDFIIQNINSELSTEANQSGINVVPLYRATRKESYGFSYYDWDFKHPNDKGYEVWAEAFLNVIQ